MKLGITLMVTLFLGMNGCLKKKSLSQTKDDEPSSEQQVQSPHPADVPPPESQPAQQPSDPRSEIQLPSDDGTIGSEGAYVGVCSVDTACTYVSRDGCRSPYRPYVYPKYSPEEGRDRCVCSCYIY